MGLRTSYGTRASRHHDSKCHVAGCSPTNRSTSPHCTKLRRTRRREETAQPGFSVSFQYILLTKQGIPAQPLNVTAETLRSLVRGTDSRQVAEDRRYPNRSKLQRLPNPAALLVPGRFGKCRRAQGSPLASLRNEIRPAGILSGDLNRKKLNFDGVPVCSGKRPERFAERFQTS